MKCPQCGNKNSNVINSRHCDRENTIMRRRVCLSETCLHRWTTYEIEALDLPDDPRKYVHAAHAVNSIKNIIDNYVNKK